MNLILLAPHELDGRRATLTDARRLKHLHDVHRARPGDELTVGIMNDRLGRATLVELDAHRAVFELGTLADAPPPALPVHLVLALPRPRMLARTLEHVTALGVKRLTLLHTKRVEKSYWQSPELNIDKIHQHFLLGLEQARDTVWPEIELVKGFRPFIEQRLPMLMKDHRGLVAHPGMPNACPREVSEQTLLLVGPEGGFIDWEVEQLLEAGCEGIHLGARILRVETAVTALLSKLF
ncbi:MULTISPECIES: 16S rRNA (uracil(1498)-N(3))-methyltransferase [unclassified Halomonas]|uniref:16S rRNA (uracil(1498)-N(3))-methyltransferase n=1 Tax=unclassified Halomonas TaxID=2609666 RepID=UPI0020A02D17|nr:MULTISPECIES: 16S rRNA (uracil(1498)-N(3))-methyltransferase [unclassified Halomonas]MCP1315083.1 16S rRNA (uracil(1498)-N(3))-methyltransferase [Halomonas sp. 707D7]MCP1325468.1 16S rRNA (uracil(1498)-N(3))-methyltransferase [Halomonas sp. 707D4]